MAKQGAPHETMSEAFAMRLRQLYPEPGTCYSEGRVVKPVGLKPDIYVRHQDGRQWVFEMVHRNHHAQHLLENHRRYSEAGIPDTWILWEDLEPRGGERRSSNQGVLAALLREPQQYSLPAPARAILAMQTGNVRHLHAFTVNALGVEPGSEWTPFIQAQLTGINVYRLENWSGQKRYPAEQVFISMHELQFKEDGSIAVPDTDLEHDILPSLAGQVGLSFDDATMMPSQAIDQFVQMPALLLEKRELLMELVLQKYLETLSLEQAQELLAFFQLKSTQETLLSLDTLPAPVASAILDDMEAMKAVADGISKLKQRLQDIGAPQTFLKFLEQLLDHNKIGDVAELMQWQEDSNALREARRGRSAKKSRAEAKVDRASDPSAMDTVAEKADDVLD